MIIDTYVRVGASFSGGGKTIEEYREEMERNGIDQAVLVPNKDVDYDIPAGNRYVADAVANAPALFYGAVRVDPWRWEMDRSKYESCLEQEGMKFLYLNPWEENFRCNHPVVWPIYEFAGERKIPVIVEAGYPIVSHVTMIYQMAARFPDTIFILTCSGQHDLSGCTEMDVATTLKKHSNVFIGTATTINAAWLAEMAAETAPGRVLFQSGYPAYDCHIELYRVTHGYLENRVKEEVLGGNMQRLLDLLQ